MVTAIRPSSHLFKRLAGCPNGLAVRSSTPSRLRHPGATPSGGLAASLLAGGIGQFDGADGGVRLSASDGPSSPSRCELAPSNCRHMLIPFRPVALVGYASP
jgi:hypothetical protein